MNKKDYLIFLLMKLLKLKRKEYFMKMKKIWKSVKKTNYKRI